MLKIKELVSLNKKGKDLLITISTILGIFVVLLTAIAFIYQFIVYIYEMQWFSYWIINTDFYVKSDTDIINGLIYGFFIICILIIMLLAMYKIVKNEDKNKKEWVTLFLFFLFMNIMIGLKDLYQKGFSIGYAAAHIISSIVIFFIMKHYAKKTTDFFMKLTDENNFDKTLKDIVLEILVFGVGLFISIIIIGNITSFFKRDYKMINSDNQCNVILYSNTDYYIVSDCDIDEISNKLIIYKSKQSKINNFNVIYEIRTFSKVEKK